VLSLGSRPPERALYTPEVLRVIPPQVLSSEQLNKISSLVSSGITPLSAAFCVVRKIYDPPSFLRPTLGELPFPFKLPGIQEGCGIVVNARKDSERPKAFIASDFDADGITSAAIVHSALSSLGFEVTAKTPCRQREGYGFNTRLLDEAVRSGAKILFLLDFGTQQKELIEKGKRRGLEIIVIDHHLCSAEDRASPNALVNPRGVSSHCTFMSAGGLSYLFCLGLCEAFPAVKFNQKEWLGLAAVSTVADVVPLIEQNRAVVRHGLAYIRESRGLLMLANKLHLTGEITPSDVAFRLAPTMNAPGRIVEKGGDLVLKLLTLSADVSAEASADMSAATELEAGMLIGCNTARKRREKLDLALAEKIIASTGLHRAIVVADDRFDPGIAGLVAARLVERYHRPAAVIAMCERSGGRSSVRGVPNFDTYLALHKCRELLVRFGGHLAAAGFTITNSNVRLFTIAFAAEAERQLGNFTPLIISADFSTSAKELNHGVAKLLDGLRACEPFGSCHPAPIWFVPQVKLLKVHEIAVHHLLLEFVGVDGKFAAYLFNNPKHPIKMKCGETLDIGVKLSRARLSQDGGGATELIEFCGISN